MTIGLPEKKIASLLALLNSFDYGYEYSLRNFARLVGKLVSSCPAVRFGWVHFKSFERFKFIQLIVNNKSFDDMFTFPKSRSSPSKITFPGFVQVIREAYRLRGIPPESFELFTNSISSATLKQYSSALSRWWYFCGTHGCDFYNSSHSDIIKFLTVEFNKGVSFSYLNVIRSAISFVRGNDFVNNLEVKRLFKGIFRSRPPRRKYDSIWDPNNVTV
ncbi:hypothetical protein PPYR_08569 [Photinus pyralis]|uniref:Core-binding (CB) domain-containing protein n=1 Tax=Photinus pyralis TaxID=7054 RepID=A0A5N4AJU8_PHOPY|nr:hypothetical protein PPYR_08569 [Photinus pyralis]